MSLFQPHIEAMQGYSPGEQPTNPRLIKLNTNENPYPPSPVVLDAIRSVAPEQLRRYPDPMGNLFRQTAASIFGVEPQMVLCGNGMDDLLNLTVRAFSGPVAKLVFPTPTYTLYAVLAEIQASMVQEVPFGPDFTLPANDLLAAGGRVTYLANPNSPSGTLVEAEVVSDLASRLTGVLVVDEAYVDFADADCMSLVHRHDNVLVLRSLSKGYSLAGLRFGFAVGPKRLIDGLIKVKDSYNVDAIAIQAAAAAISDQRHARQCWERVRTERTRLADAMTKLDLPSLPSQANFLLTTVPAKPGAAAVYEELKTRGILVRYFKLPGLDDKLRITVGTPEQNDALLKAIEEIVNTSV
jgi:histidinol-phosphate aminotransferase